MTNQVYDIINNKLIAMIEAGTAPWNKPWIGGLPVNYISRRPYSGVNLLLLPAGEYITWTQIQNYNQIARIAGHPELQAKVKKGSKSHQIVFYTVYDKKKGKGKSEDDKDEKTFVLRYYNVFHIQDVEGLESKYLKFENDPIEEAEKVLKDYDEVPLEHYDSLKAYYSPGLDKVNVPPKECFPEIEYYYKTVFHEFVHSTGSSTRLKRFEKGAGSGQFASDSYSFEELVAEIGAAMLCGVTGIENKVLDNSASYLDHWLKVLKADNKAIIRASSKAQAAVNYILKVKAEEQAQEVPEAIPA